MRFNIGNKVNLLSVSLILILGSLLGWYFIQHEKQVLNTELNERAGLLLSSLVANGEYPMIIGDQEMLDRVVRGVLKQKDVVHCRIQDHRGVVLFDAGEGNALSTLTLTATVSTLKAANASEEDLLLGTSGGAQINEEIGEISLIISRQSMEEKLSDVIRTIILVILGAVIAAALASSLLLKLVLSRPISELVRGTQRIAQGDLNYQVTLKTKDEIGLLASAFNKMTQDLSGTLVSKDYINNIIASMVDSLMVIDQKGQIKTVNQAILTLLDYQENDLLGQPASKVLGADFGTWGEFHALLAQENLKNVEKTYVARDGRPIPILFSGSVMRESDHAHPGGSVVVGFVCVAQDITERRRLESQLRQSQKLESVGQLAAGIAHEINTPAQYVSDNTRFLQEAFGDLEHVLSKYAELLHMTESVDQLACIRGEVEALIQQADINYLLEEIPRAIDQSLEGVEHVARIVKAMKEFAHPGVSDKTDIDINRAIENTITIARNEWKYVAEITTDLDPNLPMVPCLPGEFNQVILNMLMNAAQAIAEVVGDGEDEKGTITISTHRIGEWVEIRIRDTGTGIPEDIRSRVFDPFFTTKDVGKGTGQGLTICHAVIVEKHEGTITFETEMGKGSTFIIRLPLSATLAQKK